MFDTLSPAPQDPILGLTEAFNEDANPGKINLSVGVYKDAQGKTPVLRAVKQAEERILATETTKSYLSIQGSAEYAMAVQRLLFGADHEVLTSQRARTAHTPGGTGALRVAGDFIHQTSPGARIWLSQPTWPNHPGVFRAAGLEVKTYPYFDPTTNGLSFDAMLQALGEMAEGDVVVLHGCCHNPTGVDPSAEQWEQIAEVVQERKLVPIVDFAYQGLADGVREDAAGIAALCRPGVEVLVANSFSKNFGLYNERVGALTIVAPSRDTAEIALGHVKLAVRTNYSNPPAHGAAIVTTILNDPEMRATWEDELTSMRNRINHIRQLFVDTLAQQHQARDFSFIAAQRGMFSFSGLTPEQVNALRQQYAIYIVNSGRINVAGMTEQNIEHLCTAIASVLDLPPSL